MKETLKHRLKQAEQKSNPSLFGSLDAVAYLDDVQKETERLEALSPEAFDLELTKARQQKYKPFDPKATALYLTFQKRSDQAEEERIRQKTQTIKETPEDPDQSRST